jgi:hypothetical protein
MRRAKLFSSSVLLSALWIFICSFSATGQVDPQPVLVDEFGRLPCEHIHALTDGFAQEIKTEVGSKAVILINPPNERPQQAESRRRMVSSFLQLQGLDVDRFSFYKAQPSPDGEIRTQFWKLPAGAYLPMNDWVMWNEEPPNTSRAFRFGFEDEMNICPSFIPRVYAKLILDNPGSKGHVVIKAGGFINKFSFADHVINELVQTHGVPRKRLRLFFTKGKRNDSTGAEFWFVPTKKK